MQKRERWFPTGAAVFCATLLGALTSTSFADNVDAWRTTNLGETINSTDHDAFPSITKDGLALYFSRGYVSKAGGSTAEAWYDVDDWDIFVAKKNSSDH